MSLVPYSSSEDEADDDDALLPAPPSKKRKVSLNEGTDIQTGLPPLPASFFDQYSSTVRTSAQDDPSLHGGRKRVVPHVQGQWPTHVYLEWHPGREEAAGLSEVVTAVQKAGQTTENTNSHINVDSREGFPPKTDYPQHEIHSLLQNDLGVSLPLHISLSRPLALKTVQKDPFLDQLRHQIAQDSAVRAFEVRPKDLVWHPNETGTRWFLVLRLESARSDASTKGLEVLKRLLNVCNGVSRDFGQPELYAQKDSAAGSASRNATEDADHFHISLAWSLQPPGTMEKDEGGIIAFTGRRALFANEAVKVSDGGFAKLCDLLITFSEAKVRIGQDVHSLPLRSRR